MNTRPNLFFILLILFVIGLVPPAITLAASTVGNLEGISQDGVVSGWAFDPDAPSQSIDIHLYLDGPPGSGALVAITNANLPRPDVNAAYNIQGAHGFTATIPAQYLNGKIHTLYVYPIDTTPGATNVQTANSPKTFTITAHSPFGALDGVNADGTTGGWALDPDNQQDPILVHFYINGPAGSGTLIGIVSANMVRADVNAATGFQGNHGFSFPIPVAYRDGQAHPLYVYGINKDGTAGSNILLANAPKTFTLAPPAVLQFSSTFPHYTDPTTGNIVYQISSDPGVNYVFYYHQYYYRDPDSVVIVNIPPGDWRPIYYQINLRTGAKTALADQSFNCELVKDNYFYAFNFAATPRYFARMDLTTHIWEKLYDVPAGWLGACSPTINSDNTYALFSIDDTAIVGHQKLVLLHIADKTSTVLREQTSETHHYIHHEFSPTNPDIFRYGDLGVTYPGPSLGTAALGIGSISQRRLQPIQIQANPGDYFDPGSFTGIAGFTHPVWDADGRLCSDVIWHPQNPAGMYGFVCFGLGADPLAVIPSSSQELRFIPLTSWNVHFKAADTPGWFVGDGDLLKSVDGTTQNKFVDVLHLTTEPVVGARYKTEIYNLAEIKGSGGSSAGGTFGANAHLVAQNAGVITTFDNYSLAGSATRNVFLIQIPTNLRNAIGVALTPTPTLTLTTASTSIQTGQFATLSWTSTNATSCVASGAWTGSQPTNGSQQVTPTITSTYTLVCTGAGGSASQSVTVAIGSIIQPPPSPSPASNPFPFAYRFNRNLRYGMRNDLDVRALQAFLTRDKTLYPERLVTGYFGNLTRQAVIRFQERYASEILIPLGLTRGTGYVGAATLRKLNELVSNTATHLPNLLPFPSQTPPPTLR